MRNLSRRLSQAFHSGLKKTVSTIEIDKALKMVSGRLAKEHSKQVLSNGLMWILLALINILFIKG